MTRIINISRNKNKNMEIFWNKVNIILTEVMK